MAKKIAELSEVSKSIIEIFESKKEVKSNSENFPSTHSGLYNLSAIINDLEDKYTSLKIDQSFFDVRNCDDIDIKYILVKNYFYNESYPYYYLSISDEEAIKIANSYEEYSKKQSYSSIQKRNELLKKISLQTKRRKVSEKQLNSLKNARKSKKEKA